MKKTLLILCALLLTSIGASAQTYKFVCTDWVSLDQNRATASDIEYDEDANIITVVKTGDYNVALGNSTEMSQWGGITTANYTVSGWQHWFIVVGTNLSTTKADLWWMNGANYGEWDPTQVVELEDNQVLFAWDLSLMPAIDINLHNDVNYLNGWTGFGLTSTATDGTSTISDINFYTLEEAIAAYSELEGVLTETTTLYEFKAENWVALSDHSGTTATANTTDNTISVTYTANDTDNGTEAGLGNGNDSYNTAGYYVTEDQKWFVIQGKGLSTSGHLLWWMNGYNDTGSYAPTEVETLEDGSVVLAWDLSQHLGNYLLGKKNTLNGFTCFGLIADDPTTGFTITDINFYTEEGFETLISATPYTFNCKDWVASDDTRATADKFTYNETNNTITVASSGANNIAMGNSTEKSQWGGITTAAMTISKDQKWFVVIGTDISTTNTTDSYLWWLNGANKNTQVEADKVVSLDDGSVLVAWDVTNSGLDDNLQDESNLLDGWTCFGLTSTGSSSTISYIGFYTDTQMDALVGIEWEMTEAGWGTLILPFAADVPTTTDEGETATLTLYAGSALSLDTDGTTITVSGAATSIAANTPYLVSGTAGTYTFTGSYEEATGALTSGLLTGTLVDMSQENSDFATDGTQYVLQNHTGEGEEGLAFYPITEASTGVELDAYHCYLTLSSSTSGSGVRAFISLPGSDNEETGIVAVEGAEAEANGAIYDLSGRRVAKAVKGVYIQNGKKVLVR